MASTVTWNCTEAPKMEVEDMSMEEIQKMIMRLQISLNEKQQMQSLVKTAEPASKDIPNDLPF
jgi:hypothetical protein